MSKQKRPPGRDVDRTPAHSPGRMLAPDVAALGNAAIQERLGGEEAGGPVDWDVVRDVATSVVDHAGLALELEARPIAQVQRFTDLLAGSRLPDDRKQVLIDKLTTDHASALTVREAMERTLGSDGPDLRAALSDALDTVQDALRAGGVHGGAWVAGDRAVALSAGAAPGSVTERSAALIADLAGALSTAPAVRGPEVRSFCLAVHLALNFDEEEEDEAEWAEPGGVEEG